MRRSLNDLTILQKASVGVFAALLFGLTGCTSSSGNDENASGGTGDGGDATASAPATPAPVPEGEMRVTLLGTGSPVLTDERMGNSTLIQAGGLDLVVDAGRGTAIRLGQAGVGPGGVDGMFITHFHSDHINGLADVWMTGYIPAIGFKKRPLPALWSDRNRPVGCWPHRSVQAGFRHPHR